MNNARMFLLTILISFGVVAQSGWTAYAIENPQTGVNAAGITANANEGRSNKDPPRPLELLSPELSSFLRRLQKDETSEELLTESVEELVKAVEELEEDPVQELVNNPGNPSVDELAKAVEELEKESVLVNEPEGAIETTYPEDNTPSPSSQGTPDELSEAGGGGTDDEGEPLVFDITNSPTPGVETPVPSPAPTFGGGADGYVEDTPVPTPGDWNESNGQWYEDETPSPTYNDNNGGNDWDWGEASTPKPTVEYIPKDEVEDPLIEELEPDTKDFNKDDVFYHGLGDKLGGKVGQQVGKYLDGVESPQEMEKDKNIQVIAGILVGSFMVMMLVTAHLVMQYPDGLCAGCCRLTNKIICCFTRTLCLPCRAICCKGSEQSQGRRTHAPMRTPFPTDLELA